jgi:hypothetical protein
MPEREGFMLAPEHPLGEKPSARDVLDRLIRSRQPDIGNYALFFVTDDGEPYDDGSGQSSGNAIDGRGTVYEFVVEWGAGQRMGKLMDWCEIEPEPHWRESREYQAAREAVGLPRG